MYKIESLLSARLFLRPQIVDNYIYFLSNISGHLSLYRMKFGGSVPEPLIPPDIALQNPHFIDGHSFFVFPGLGKIIVMIDEDGDENYQPKIIPIQGGFPESILNDLFRSYRVHLGKCDSDKNICYLSAESRTEQKSEAYLVNLEDEEFIKIGESPWGFYPDGATADHSMLILIDSYTIGDHVLYLWTASNQEYKKFFGTPIDQRLPDQSISLNGIQDTHFTEDESHIIFITTLFEDTGGLAMLSVTEDKSIKPIHIIGTSHTGIGELENLKHLKENKYILTFNIDGSSWVYEAEFNESNLQMNVIDTICGPGIFSNGVLESIFYNKKQNRYSLVFSSATSPTQIYTYEKGPDPNILRHTEERILGIENTLLSQGEEASYQSFDGKTVSARLYLPSEKLGYNNPRPLIYYIHGGPQSQERPDFAWFSMPLIQYLTLFGFAVFVPNVRGSSGYGMAYSKLVDKDWGGDDRLDHVFAMKNLLPEDERIDIKRAGVIGRSYGGYMSLTLAGRHPDLWSAAVDMFGPYDLTTFLDRIPETWKPYFNIVLGDPKVEADKKFLIERSPKTHLHNLACPLLVIQGKNDPRVVAQESADLVENLRSQGKKIELLVFENEGHDVLKFENRVKCYTSIANFFNQHLSAEQ